MRQLRILGRVFVETFLGIKRSGWSNWLVISILAIALTIFGSVLQLTMSLKNLVNLWGSQMVISAFLSDKYEPREVARDVSQYKEVRLVEVITKDVAWEGVAIDGPFGQPLPVEEVDAPADRREDVLGGDRGPAVGGDMASGSMVDAGAPRSFVVQGRTVTVPVRVRDAVSITAMFVVPTAGVRRLVTHPALQVPELLPGRALCVLAVASYLRNPQVYAAAIRAAISARLPTAPLAERHHRAAVKQAVDVYVELLTKVGSIRASPEISTRAWR